MLKFIAKLTLCLSFLALVRWNKKQHFSIRDHRENLNLLLKELKNCRPDIFLSDKKEDYHINNSSNHVYYKGYNGLSDKKTTPYVVDIKSDKI